MRAITLASADSLPVSTDFPDPDPHSGHETLELVGAGLHQVVRALATGAHYGSSHEYPLVPGVDAVARTGGGHLVYAAGTRSPWGTMAQRLAPSITLDLPTDADPLAVAAGMNPGMSGWIPLTVHRDERGALGTVLVLGATGMAGSMAAQAALTLGAQRVIGAGRDAGSLESLREAGVETADLADPRALEQTLAAGVPDLVLDYVWGPVAEAAFAALGRGGSGQGAADISYVQIGSLAGAEASVPASLLRSRRLRLSGSGLGSFSTERLHAELPRLLAHIADGTLPVPYTVYPFGSIEEAWAHTGRSRAVVVPD
ncbi:MAG: NAD-dependent epimerase/dehydratase family protein [Brachybacterium tyrofermentans]|uniref:NAD-dependent epimerase/dehydratase family protein n=1 Tax=Brachybacterium tyrofermentans TaxID=47848 RepID=UPI001868E92E|nr:NAD-dependent epimerase/dehydratase family protein [Brachybacterium tyrofermentans]